MLTDDQRAQVWAEAMRRGPAWPCGKGVLRSAIDAIDDAIDDEIETGAPDPCAQLQAAYDAAVSAGLLGVLLGSVDLADLLARVEAARAYVPPDPNAPPPELELT